MVRKAARQPSFANYRYCEIKSVQIDPGFHFSRLLRRHPNRYGFRRWGLAFLRILPERQQGVAFRKICGASAARNIVVDNLKASHAAQYPVVGGSGDANRSGFSNTGFFTIAAVHHNNHARVANPAKAIRVTIYGCIKLII